MNYNRLFNSKYYAWRRSLKSDVDEDGDRDIEQFKHTEDMARWKFKDHIERSVVDCAWHPLYGHYWGYKITSSPIVIDPHTKKEYKFKKKDY